MLTPPASAYSAGRPANQPRGPPRATWGGPPTPPATLRRPPLADDESPEPSLGTAWAAECAPKHPPELPRDAQGPFNAPFFICMYKYMDIFLSVPAFRPTRYGCMASVDEVQAPHLVSSGEFTSPCPSTGLCVFLWDLRRAPAAPGLSPPPPAIKVNGR